MHARTLARDRVQIIWFLHRAIGQSQSTHEHLKARADETLQFCDGHDIVLYWGHPLPLMHAHNQWRPDPDDGCETPAEQAMPRPPAPTCQAC